MIDPIFWLGLSILLVAVSLTAVLIVALPAFQELARAARSAEKLFDTLSRELPPTLEAIRLTGMEISDLTDEMSQGVQSAGQVVKQVDQGIGGAKKQAQNVQATTRSVVTGVRAAWTTFTRKPVNPSTARRSPERLPPNSSTPMNLRDRHSPASLNLAKQAIEAQDYEDFAPEDNSVAFLEEADLEETAAPEQGKTEYTNEPSQ